MFSGTPVFNNKPTAHCKPGENATTYYRERLWKPQKMIKHHNQKS